MFTDACPSRCVYCDIASQRGRQRLTGPQVETVARQLIELGFEETMFAGGEPFLSPHLPAALRILAGHTRTAVFTGGLPGVTDKVVETCAQESIDRVVFSMDSGDPVINDEIRGREGITAALVELAEAVRARSLRVGRSINTVVSRHNVEVLDGVWDKMGAYGFNSWSLTVAGDFFEGSPEDSFLSPDQLERFYLETVPRLAKRLGGEGAELIVLPTPQPLLEAGLHPVQWGFAAARHRRALQKEFEHYARGDYNASFVRRYGCPLVGKDIVIGVGGEIHPCSQAPIIHPRYVVGNVKDQTISEILEGEKLAAFRADVPHDPCLRCWAPSNIPRETLTSLMAQRTRGRAATAVSST